MPSSKGAKRNIKAANDEVTTVVQETPPVRKRSNKKPVKVVAIVTPNGIEGSFQQESRRPLIVHLGIHSDNLDFKSDTLTREPAIHTDKEPEPYDASTNDMFHGKQEDFSDFTVAKEGVYENVIVTESSSNPMPCFSKKGLMVQFKNTVESKTLPVSTSIACFWCVHTFEGTPCIIPEREVNGVYNVYGNFCSPECGVAHLLSESIDPHIRWERMALLHRIYDREGNGQIFPAPARESLTLFGGPMSIQSFRATVREGKVRIDLHMPPMVSILGSIDTKPIDFFDNTSRNNGAINAPVKSQHSVEEGLRLKRSKPLKNKESTLDTVMNFKINTSGRKGA
jgi:hypothetical protein